MIRSLGFVVLCLLFMLGSAGEVQAQAHAGIPIVWGSGETIAHVGELPNEIKREIDRELQADVAIGFIYNHAHLFWIEAWNSNGRFVLYEGDQYWELEDNVWREILGDVPAEKFSPPLSYRFPLLIPILICIAVGYGVQKWLFKSEQEQTVAWLKDPLHQEAMRILWETQEAEEGPIWGTVNEVAFQKATAFLEEKGIAPSEAQQAVTRIGEVAIQTRFEHWVNHAVQLDIDGEHVAAAAVFRDLERCFSDDDPRKQEAGDLLAAIQHHATAQKHAAECTRDSTSTPKPSSAFEV